MASSKRIDDGGTAFGHAVVTVDGNGQPLTPNEADALQMGLTIRDWFAGQALAALIPAYQAAYGSPTSACMEIVQEAYGYADIMIAHRKGNAP